MGKRGPKAAPITRRQAECFNLIRDGIASNGYAPSVRELMAAMGTKSFAGVHSFLCELEEKGYIVTVPDVARSITIIRHPEANAYRPIP